jgi:hypothetical protein
MRINPAGVAYSIGLFFFALLYHRLKHALEPWLFFITAVAYLLAIRYIGELIAKRIDEQSRRKSGSAT